MSGVNRNILKNTGIPVTSQDQIPMELVSNAGTRFVLLNWPVKTYISASEGGDCEGITVQWTPDVRLASEPDDFYQALTSSVIPCASSSLIPLTSSLGWSVTIDSTYNTGSNSYYYIRSFQNKSGGGRGPYSNVVSLETRSPKLYGTDMYSTEYQYGIYDPAGPLVYPGCTGSVLTFTVDSFVPQTGELIAWSGDKFGAAVTMSVQSGSLQPTKFGGPNYDAIITNGATMSFALTGSPSGSETQTNSIQDGGYFNWGSTGGRQPYPDPAVSPYNNVVVGGVQVQPYSMRSYTTSVGLISGSLTIIGNSGYHVKYTATTSSQVNDICFIKDGIEYPGIPTGSNTVNKVIGTLGYGYGNKLGWYYASGSGATGLGTSSINIDPAISSIGSNVRIETSPDCVFRVISFGTLYNSDIYDQQYGVIPVPIPPPPPSPLILTGSQVLPIPSSSVLNLWSDFGYPSDQYTASYGNATGSGWMDLNMSSSKYIQLTGSLTTGSSLGLGFDGTTSNLSVLSSSLSGIQNNNYTIQFIATLPSGSTRRALFGNPSYVGDNNEDIIFRNDVLPLTTSIDLRTDLELGIIAVNRYNFPATASSQLITLISSGSTIKFYNGLEQIPSSSAGFDTITGSFNLFNNMVTNGRAVYFGYNVDIDTDNYNGNLHNLLIYSRSLSDNELSSSYSYFTSLGI